MLFRSVLANVWQTDEVARIDPATGRVKAWIDLKGLLTPRERQSTDVLNGIAYDPAGDRLFVTGKLWPKLFEIQLVPQGRANLPATPAGRRVVEEGALGDQFFVIVGGTAKVTRRGRRVATLGRGDAFGELSLLVRSPRNATVTAETDLDVLVRPSEFERVRSSLEAEGWAQREPDRPGKHSSDLERGDHVLDLHHQPNLEMVVPGRLEDTLSFLQTEPASRPLRSGRWVTVLSPTDSLLHTIVHGTQWFQSTNARWVVDADRLRCTGRIDWGRLVSLATLFRVAPVVSDALDLLGRVTGEPAPAGVREELDRVHVSLADDLAAADIERGGGLVEQPERARRDKETRQRYTPPLAGGEPPERQPRHVGEEIGRAHV